MPFFDISTNVGCSINCQYCPQLNFINEYIKRCRILKMTFETFKICVDKIPPDIRLSFAGFSEPWLNHDCTKMILYAFKEGHRHIEVATTLVGMTAADIEQLEELPFDSFRVHLPSSHKYENIIINDSYVNVLSRLDKSKIHNKMYHYHCSNKPHPKIEALIKNKAMRLLTCSRSVSIPELMDIHLPGRKRGIITCVYDDTLRSSELLPNGDVLLCCMDFEMNHTLGNLLTQDYESLYSGKEFIKVKSALKDKSSEIVCRHCMVSRTVKRDLDYYLNLLNSDIRIVMYKIAQWPTKNMLFKKAVKVLGLDKIHINI